jgi:hypothetical protein
LIDFTFSNPLIQKYFEGDDSYIPSAELVYLHEHPLITQSFLVEMETLINKASLHIQKKNIVGTLANKFINSAIKLGAELPTVSQQNAPIILSELRTVYSLCKSLLNQ